MSIPLTTIILGNFIAGLLLVQYVQSIIHLFWEDQQRKDLFKAYSDQEIWDHYSPYLAIIVVLFGYVWMLALLVALVIKKLKAK